MAQTVLYRLAGVALVVGAGVVSVGNLLAPQGGARAAVASGRYVPLALAVLLGGLLVMGSWPAVYLRQRAESRLLGFVGFVLVLAAGLLLSVAFPLLQLLIYPWLAPLPISSTVLNDGPASFNVFFALVSALVSLGGILFGVATIRAKVFSRQVGIGLIVLAVASFVLGFLSLPGGGGIHMSWWWATTGTFGVVAYMVALGWYGIELLRNAAAATLGPAAGGASEPTAVSVR
jgi:hypothetical protein